MLLPLQKIEESFRYPFREMTIHQASFTVFYACELAEILNAIGGMTHVRVKVTADVKCGIPCQRAGVTIAQSNELISSALIGADF